MKSPVCVTRTADHDNILHLGNNYVGEQKKILLVAVQMLENVWSHKIHLQSMTSIFFFYETNKSGRIICPTW